MYKEENILIENLDAYTDAYLSLISTAHELLSILKIAPFMKKTP